MKTYIHTNLYAKVPSSTIHNSPRAETRSNVAGPYNGVLLGNEKTQNINQCYNMVQP